jgi:hypothetical protein
LAIFIGILGFLFALGIGIYILKNARELSEPTFRASGEILGIGFWIWVYRIAGLWAIGLAIFILYMIFDTIFFS